MRGRIPRSVATKGSRYAVTKRLSSTRCAAGVERVEASYHPVVDLDDALVVPDRDALVDAVEARRVGRPDGEAGEAVDVVGERHEPARVAGAGEQPGRHREVALPPCFLRRAGDHVPSRRADARGRSWLDGERL